MELVALLFGILLGLVFAYIFFLRRIETIATARAKELATFMFEQQRAQLEQSIHQIYQAKLNEWKASELAQTVERERQDALDKARVVLKGKIGEQMAPLLPEFVSLYNPADSRFIGSPIDYVIFKNLSRVAEGSEEEIEIVLLDVKAGQQAGLTRVQRKIKEAVEKGRVKWDTLRLLGSPPPSP